MRFFLDNNLSPRHARALAVVAEIDGIDVTHLRARFPQDAHDEDWMPTLAREGGWVVISGDLRIATTPHLRRIWLESRLTTFFLWLVS